MIAIIGAGISGLTLACELQKWCEPCMVLEAAPRTGGMIRSEKKQGYLLEKGPNSILADASIKSYLSKLGLSKEIVHPSPISKSRFVYRKGRYRKLPGGPLSLFFGSFFSPRARLSVLKEFFKKSQGSQNETLGEFIERRFSKELVDYGLNPFISGIYAGDPYKLLVSETFPFLADYERDYGSVLKGFAKSKTDNTRKESLYFRNGMETLTKALQTKVKNLRLETKVQSIEKTAEGFRLTVNSPQGQETLEFESVVMACNAYTSGNLLRKNFPRFAETVLKINYVPIIKAFLAFDKNQIHVPLNGFGGLNPQSEKLYSLGSFWNSSVYPHTAPTGKVFLTTLVGGALHEGYTHMKDDFVLNKVIIETKELFKISGNPEFADIHRISKAIPQYETAVQAAKDEIALLESKGIYIASNWTEGLSVADCIKKSIRKAVQITEVRSGIAEYKGCC